MQNLTQARKRQQSAGEPIAIPFKGLRDLGVEIRRGQLTMVSAAPGGGKSLIAQALVHYGGGEGHKNTALYFSADSGPEVMYERAAALSTDLGIPAVREMVAAGNTAMIDAAVTAKESHITYSFASTPSMDYVERELNAYLELHGTFPEVIVADNLKDFSDDQEADEFRALEDTAMFLKAIARDTGAAVIALHHVTGAFEGGDQPISLLGIRGKVSKTPALILTLHRPQEGTLRISIVKNRNGKANSSGSLWVGLEANAERMEFNG